MRLERHERGAALVETVLLGLILIVPLIWALGVLGELHRGALAATAAAREAGLDAARAPDLASADRSVAAAVATAFRHQGLDPSEARVRWTAGPNLPRGGTVEVEVKFPVTVLQAPLLGAVSGPSVWVEARHVARVDLYRSRP
jgi:Flp pilus assembly protein TadG